MKVLSLTLLVVLAAVNANPLIDSTPWHLVQDELTIDNCEQLTKQGANSVKTIITTADKTQNCVKDFARVLDSSNGVVIIIGSEKSSLALTCWNLNEQNKLYHNKYYVLPSSVQRLREFVYNSSELDIKVYVTLELWTKQLNALLSEFIRDSRYEDAVDLSKFLYNVTRGTSGRSIIVNTVNQFLKNEEYVIMNYAFKLVKNGAKDIVDNCFPRIFKQIFSSQRTKILNQERTGLLKLSPEKDYRNDRWLYSECPDKVVNDVYNWTFNPVWNMTLNSVLFEIKDDDGMKLKLNFAIIGHYTSTRLAWGDNRDVDVLRLGRFKWRLMPTGFQESLPEKLLFCIVDNVYNSCLLPNKCEQTKEDVVGKRMECNRNVGWIIEPM